MRIIPKKSLGQNFLINKEVINKIIEVSNIKPDDVVIEIGPGRGALTEKILERTKNVIAIEKDTRLYNYLKEKFPNLDIRNEDILDFDPPEKYKIISNLPFYIAYPIIKKFLTEENRPQSMTLLIQGEVGERICATPPNMSRPSISTQLLSNTKILFEVGKSSFYPKPKVNSVVIKVIPKKNNINQDIMFKLLEVGFREKRKKIVNNFSKYLEKEKEEVIDWLRNNQININKRAEELTLYDWKSLIDTYLQN